uniref:Leucine-rich repeat n=1 Tax=Solanum tuberosum TaxID=4113 RepID=M1AQV8_SOLTU
MSPSVARGVQNLRRLEINYCDSLEEVTIEEEQQGEEIMTNEPLFLLLEDLELEGLPKLGHFILTKCALEFPFLRKVNIVSFPEMKTFVQQGSVSALSLESVNNDKVIDLNKAMFNSKLVSITDSLRAQSHTDEVITIEEQQGEGINLPKLGHFFLTEHALECSHLEELSISRVNSISVVCSHQLPTAYFTELETLQVVGCGKLRNLISPSMAKGLLNLQVLYIKECESMEEVITKGEGIMTLFPLLEQLVLTDLPKLGNFFLTEHALEFPLLRNVTIRGCPGMKTFVLQGISVSTPSLKRVNRDRDDLFKWTQQMLHYFE